ncbi:MAG: hypothetical protein K9G60_08580, partial [Pseudolabrys sp.]|nr:hypothetical protein [Pseudolabrys sp.]
MAGPRTSYQTWRKERCSRLYSGTAPARLWRTGTEARLWRGAAAASALLLALAGAGCTLSSQFDSMFNASNSDVTGSILPPPG